jgi:hypothetical protein
MPRKNPALTAAIRKNWKRQDKVQYAEDHADHLDGFRDEPQRPASLSYMGAQAIRLTLSAVHNESIAV